MKLKPVIEYELVWSDEFDGTSLSTDNWQYETGYGDFGWGNDEWQLYTTSPSNLSVSGGNLIINAQCANPPNCGKRSMIFGIEYYKHSIYYLKNSAICLVTSLLHFWRVY